MACTRSTQSASSPAARERLGEAPAVLDPAVLEDVEHRVLGVGRVERVEPSRRAMQLPERLLLERRAASRRRRARCRSRRTPRSAWLMTSTASTRSRRRAARGRGRVVELVREPGGHRAQRGEPLAAGLARVDAAHHRADHVHDLAGAPTRCASASSMNSLARDDRDAAVGPSAHDVTGSGLSVIAAIAPIQVGAVVGRQRLGAPVDGSMSLGRAVEEQQRARASRRPARAAPRPSVDVADRR